MAGKTRQSPRHRRSITSPMGLRPTERYKLCAMTFSWSSRANACSTCGVCVPATVGDEGVPAAAGVDDWVEGEAGTPLVRPAPTPMGAAPVAFWTAGTICGTANWKSIGGVGCCAMHADVMHSTSSAVNARLIRNDMVRTVCSSGCSYATPNIPRKHVALVKIRKCSTSTTTHMNRPGNTRPGVRVSLRYRERLVKTESCPDRY